MNFEWSMNITKTDNGYLLSLKSGKDEEHLVVQKIDAQDDNEAEQVAISHVLRIVCDHFGVFNSKHNKTRLNIEVTKQ